MFIVIKNDDIIYIKNKKMTSYKFLILDIKIVIALCDDETWIRMVLYDEEFKKYAYKNQGLKKFVDQFTQIINGETLLFGKLHSIDDKPAKVDSNGTQIWYYNDKIHREHDLPAGIGLNGDQAWWYHGKYHRENDLPAIIYENNTKKWYYHGKRHRENDLPASMYVDGTKYWFYHGKHVFL